MTAPASARLTIGILAAFIVVLAGLGAFLEAFQGGPGTIAFVVRVCLVTIAVVGAILLAFAWRMSLDAREAGGTWSQSP